MLCSKWLLLTLESKYDGGSQEPPSHHPNHFRSTSLIEPDHQERGDDQEHDIENGRVVEHHGDFQNLRVAFSRGQVRLPGKGTQ